VTDADGINTPVIKWAIAAGGTTLDLRAAAVGLWLSTLES